MSRTRTLLALLLAQSLALGAAAQSEFGRASGGTINAIAKAPRQFSGSLTLTHSTGAARGRGYEGTVSGELVDDRAWFFASAAILPQMQFSTPNFRSQQPTGSFSSSFLSLRSTSGLSFSFSRSDVQTGVSPSLLPRP